MRSENRIAIEGPCCAGKTTLATGIMDQFEAGQVATIPDFADYVGGGSGMPDPADARPEAQINALEQLLSIEARRFSAWEEPVSVASLVLIDRSALTLIGHCAGLDQLHGSDALRFLAAGVVIPDARSVLPTHVIYLDVTNSEQLARNHGKFPEGSVFMDPTFNVGFRDYFESDAGSDGRAVVHWVDGSLDADAVLGESLRFLDQHGLLPATQASGGGAN